MEMLLYLFGNWCCIGAALILLYHWFKKQRDERAKEMANMAAGGGNGQGIGAPQGQQQQGGFTWRKSQEPEGYARHFGLSSKDILISRDLMIMLWVGTIARVYWSCSPPAVWSEEPMFIQYISISDVFISPVLWSFIVYFIARNTTREETAPSHFRWPALTIAAFVMGVIGAKFLPPLDTDDSWPFADIIVMWNMVLDGFAMIPQMHLIANSQEKASSEASHFVGLLCLGRVFRMMFWGTLLVAQLMSGDDHGHYIWTFIVPDLLHTFIMGDYLYLWLKKVKKDQIEPMMQGAYGAYGSMNV